jgi:hypothetical protein
MTTDWDDQRLEGAFTARAAAAVMPPTAALTALTIERLRHDRMPRPALVRLGSFAGLAAVVAVVLVGVIGVGFRGVGPPATASPPGSAASGSTAPTGSSGVPSSSTGVSTSGMSVGVAVALRDASTEPGEIEVTGWLRGGVPVPCPFSLHPNPARLSCPPALPSIVEDPVDAGPGRLNVPPSGPWIQPSFALVDDGPVPNPQPDADPIEITVTGHFHDRRASLCDSASACGATFVVDRIDSIGGVPILMTTSYDLAIQAQKGSTTTGLEIPPTGPADQYDGDVLGQGPGLGVLSRRVMSIDGLLDAEPALVAGWPGMGTATIVSSITAAEMAEGSGPPLPRTFLVPDDSEFLYEMTHAGPVVVGNLAHQVFPAGLVGRVGEPITVSEAINHRDHALDDTELLVSGFAWEPGPLTCTPALPSMPVLDQCPSTFTWLAEGVPALVKSVGPTRPDGPALNLVIPPESANLALLTQQPTEVVVLGHFDDHRSPTCPEVDVGRCRRNFIVDAILNPAKLVLDPDLATSVHPGPSNIPHGTVSWATQVAGLTDADRADRLVVAFPVAVAALSAFEPDTLGAEAVANSETAWYVHFLDQDAAGIPIVRTRIVLDTDPDQRPAQVFDITKAGLSRALAANP